MAIKAMVFDMDGTLVQTEKLKALSYARAAVELCPDGLTEEEVIEDSPSGVQAAVSAGMHCIAVTTPFTRTHLREQDVLTEQWIVDDPEQLLKTVDSLLAEEGTPANR